MITEIENKIRNELEKAQIDRTNSEVQIKSVGKDWWIEIYFLEEESFEYLSNTISVLSSICEQSGSLENHTCQISIKEDPMSNELFYLLAKFKPSQYSYDYRPGTYNYPYQTGSKNYPSSNLWQTSGSHTTKYSQQEQEEGLEIELSQNKSFEIEKDDRNQILKSSTILDMSESELSHITRVISDRMYSEETPSLKGPHRLPGNTNSRYWTTSSKTITIYKIKLSPSKTEEIAFKYCYIVDVLHKLTTKEVSYFLTTFNDLRKMEFY